MKIVYITRDYKRSWKSDPKKVIGAILKKTFFYFGTEGFFESSINKSFEVKEISASKAIEKAEKINKDFDAVFVHYACDLAQKGQSSSERLLEIANAFSIPKILFYCFDRADSLPDTILLNAYNLIFKREAYKNRDRYEISEEHNKKMFSTILGSPLKPEARLPIFQPFVNLLVPDLKNKTSKEYDVFFSGTVAKFNNYRADIWREVKRAGFKTVGGLQYRNRGNKPEEELLASEMNKKQYVDTINKSKICLALNGVGEFTFRHLELWQLGAFMLCPQVINELDLPINPKDGKHFVSFSDKDDLISKISYYLEHDRERENIARAGRAMFEKEYSSEKHGKYIKNTLQEEFGSK